MKLSNPKYITDDSGRRIYVVLPVDEYELILEALEDRQNMPNQNAAKASGLRGKINSMNNDEIDQQFNTMRDEWQKDI